jgi:hypothetical protein
MLCFTWSTAQTYTFPLHISSNHRYLADANGKPFFYASDSGWWLFFGLNMNETRKYFSLRKQQGFSVIQVQLTAIPGAVNREGEKPFADNDITKPNEKFFDYADQVIALADSFHLVLEIAPLWYGCCNEAWGSYMKKAGVTGCKQLGSYIGNHYKKYNNIIWIMGGDNDPGNNRNEIRALALAIKSAAPKQLITYHAASSHSSTDIWDSTERWLDISMTYTYFRGFHKAWNYVQPDVYEVNYTEYRKVPTKPFVLGESTYENEHTDVTQTELQVRKQAWYSMLSGACGYSYGSPFWSVGSKWFKQEDWKTVIELPGANTMKYLNDLFHSFQWQTLIPDIEGRFIISGNNKYATNDYAVTAYTADKKILISYIPSPRKLKLNARFFPTKRRTALWYNPRTGTRTEIKNINFNDELSTPDKKDWVLIIRVP